MMNIDTYDDWILADSTHFVSELERLRSRRRETRASYRRASVAVALLPALIWTTAIFGSRGQIGFAVAAFALAIGLGFFAGLCFYGNTVAASNNAEAARNCLNFIDLVTARLHPDHHTRQVICEMELSGHIRPESRPDRFRVLARHALKLDRIRIARAIRRLGTAYQDAIVYIVTRYCRHRAEGLGDSELSRQIDELQRIHFNAIARELEEREHRSAVGYAEALVVAMQRLREGESIGVVVPGLRRAINRDINHLVFVCLVHRRPSASGELARADRLAEVARQVSSRFHFFHRRFEPDDESSDRPRLLVRLDDAIESFDETRRA